MKNYNYRKIKDSFIAFFHCIFMNITYHFISRNKTLKDAFESVSIPTDLIEKRKYRMNINLRYWKFHIKKAGFIEVMNWEGFTADVNTLSDIEVFKSVFMNGVRWEDTKYYTKFFNRLDKKGTGRTNTKTWEDYKNKHLLRWVHLYRAIKDHGYKTQFELNQKVCPPKEIEVAISKDGDIIFIDGRHRLAIVKILNIEIIPVIINSVDPRILHTLNLDPRKTTPKMLMDALMKYKHHTSTISDEKENNHD